jgi:hypothetical protein
MIFLFSLTTFLSAFLLFLVQPLLAKAVLPALGGTPNVWNTCVLSFQILLLLGYGYTDWQTRWAKSFRALPILHVLIYFICIFISTFHVVPNAPELFAASPILSLVGHILFSVGAFFFILACTSPILQFWLSCSNTKSSNDPYFLYVASNIGSLLGLLLYPLAVEPYLNIEQQSILLFYSGIVLGVLMVFCVYKIQLSSEKDRQLSAVVEATHQPETVHPNFKKIILWIVLAFFPSCLMLGFTSHVTTNIAAVPLFWVLPLAGYLLTFILAFQKGRKISLNTLIRFLPIVVIIGAPLPFYDIGFSPLTNVIVQYLIFFYLSFTAHVMLCELRPSAKYLTKFYFCLSLGGALGGLFNSIIAPSLFSSIIEYPLALVFGILVYAISKEFDNEEIDPQSNLKIFVFVLLGVVLIINFILGDKAISANLAFGYGLPCLVIFALRYHKMVFSLMFILVYIYFLSREVGVQGQVLYRARNFYGARSVVLNHELNLKFLRHGTINHGSQSALFEKRLEPLAYFSKKGPVGDIFNLFKETNLDSQVGIIGLGVGAMACYAKNSEKFIFFELDPLVAEIAANKDYFTYLSDCPGKYEVVLGDGRLTLADRRDAEFKLLFLDAFSSDAVPVHLLTKEANALYFSKIQNDGMIVFNISNHYMDFRGLLAAHARDFGAKMLYRDDTQLNKEDEKNGKLGSIFAVVSKNEKLMQSLEGLGTWKKSYITNPKPWSDDYSSMLGVMKF